MKSIINHFNHFGRFKGSLQYWENRYKSGGNSGTGSYNNLAQFKAETLNDFYEQTGIDSVIEYGCGDGNQLLLANYKKYIGLDVSQKAVEICQEKFKNDVTKSFFYYNPYYFTDNGEIFKADLVISLDVIFHLVEDQIYDIYMDNLFKSAEKYVIIYSSNYESEQTNHVKHHKFTQWIEDNKPGWKLISHIENKYPYDKHSPNETSLCDFYIFKKMD